jgi:hypothetical protein
VRPGFFLESIKVRFAAAVHHGNFIVVIDKQARENEQENKKPLKVHSQGNVGRVALSTQNRSIVMLQRLSGG